MSHSHYPPEGVANYTIMLMLMATRKMNHFKLRAYDLHPCDEVRSLAEYVPLDELYARSNVITLHLDAAHQYRPRHAD